MTRTHVIYNAMMTRGMSCIRRRRSTREELRAFELEVCEARETVVNLSVLMCTSSVNTIKFHFLNHLVQNSRTLGDIPFQDASNNEHSSIHAKNIYQSCLGGEQFLNQRELS